MAELEELKLPAALVEAQKRLRNVVQNSGIQLSSGLINDPKIPLTDLSVNLESLSTEFERERRFKNTAHDSYFSSEAKRARLLEEFGTDDFTGRRCRFVKLEEIFQASRRDSVNDASEELATHEARNDESTDEMGMMKNNVLVFGSADSGKSTIFLLVVECLWATGSLWKEKFDLVLAVELGRLEVQAASDLCELLAQRFGASLSMEKRELVEIAQYFRHHPSRLCIVLDGLDECSLDGCSEYMRGLLLRRPNVDVNVVVTSRRCEDAYELSRCGEYGRQLEVIRFSPQDVEAYARKTLRHDQAEDMLEKLRFQPHMLALMGTPLYAALACNLYRSGHGLAKSTTSLYEFLLLHVLERQAGVQYESLQKVDPAGLEVLYELSRFALAMLSVQKAVFSETDVLDARLSHAALQLGLLVPYKADTPVETRQYRFPAPSLQEFLAAWYVSREVLKDERDSAWLVKRVGHYSSHMAMFWRFVIALLPRRPSLAVMEHLWQLIRAGQTSSPSRLADACLVTDIVHYASRSSTQGQLLTMQGALATTSLTYERMKELAGKLFQDTCGKGNGHRRVENALPPGRQLTDELYLALLMTEWHKDAVDPSTSAAFLAAMHAADADAAWQLQYRVLQTDHQHCANILAPASATTTSAAAASDVVTPLFHSLQADMAPPLFHPHQAEVERRSLARLLVAHHEHCEYWGMWRCDSLCSFFTRVFADGVDFSGVFLTRYKCMCVGAFLRAHSCIAPRTVNLHDCCVCDDDFEYLAPGLLYCKSVRVLDLSSNSFSDIGATCTIILSMSANLQEVHLDDSSHDFSASSSPFEALCACERLEVVRLGSLYFHGIPVAWLRRVVESCHRLRELVVHGNLIRCDDKKEAARFTTAVQRHQSLCILDVKFYPGTNPQMWATLRHPDSNWR
eukprot:scpid81304/ scgid8940/ Nucleotide-binding oligomerization domain-containing protein 2; Caspase recruitment domain-containing protein 15